MLFCSFILYLDKRSKPASPLDEMAITVEKNWPVLLPLPKSKYERYKKGNSTKLHNHTPWSWISECNAAHCFYLSKYWFKVFFLSQIESNHPLKFELGNILKLSHLTLRWII